VFDELGISDDTFIGEFRLILLFDGKGRSIGDRKLYEVGKHDDVLLLFSGLAEEARSCAFQRRYWDLSHWKGVEE